VVREEVCGIRLGIWETFWAKTNVAGFWEWWENEYAEFV
jgi:hypothetical protein